MARGFGGWEAFQRTAYSMREVKPLDEKDIVKQCQQNQSLIDQKQMPGCTGHLRVIERVQRGDLGRNDHRDGGAGRNPVEGRDEAADVGDLSAEPLWSQDRAEMVLTTRRWVHARQFCKARADAEVDGSGHDHAVDQSHWPTRQQRDLDARREPGPAATDVEAEC